MQELDSYLSLGHGLNEELGIDIDIGKVSWNVLCVVLSVRV